MPKEHRVSSGHGPDPEQPAGGDRRAGDRVNVVVSVRCRYESVLDFAMEQSVNISRSGMFIASEAPAAPGSAIRFEFVLGDGYTLLAGAGEVVRVVVDGGAGAGGAGRGMGVRFTELDPANRALIDRIVAVNREEGRSPTQRLDFDEPAATAAATTTTTTTAAAPPAPAGRTGSRAGATPPPPIARTGSRAIPPAPIAGSGVRPGAAPPPPAAARTGSRPAPAGVAAASTPAPAPEARRSIQLVGRSLRVVLGADTVACFVSSPLLHARMGGFFVPAEEDIALGTALEVGIVGGGGEAIVAAKGKVVAKQDLRIGVRLADADKAGLVRLQAEVAKLAAAAKK